MACVQSFRVIKIIQLVKSNEWHVFFIIFIQHKNFFAYSILGLFFLGLRGITGALLLKTVL